MPDFVDVAQALALLAFLAKSTAAFLVHLPLAVLRCCLTFLSKRAGDENCRGCTFFEGTVFHERQKPVPNSFRYNVRMALVDLDRPPTWWHSQATDHMAAHEARTYAGTTGALLPFLVLSAYAVERAWQGAAALVADCQLGLWIARDSGVLLLTTPVSAGYSQNPISVYYCLGAAGVLQVCIAEVTNTPWGARVTFLFQPQGQDVPKAMHVSPFMDMQSTWHIKAPMPGETCYLSVSATHPEMGPFFLATFKGKRSDSALHSDVAGFKYLMRYGFMPHRVAFWIYWQALRLLIMGVPFFGYPAPECQEKVEQKSGNPKDSAGRRFWWQAPKSYPWNAF